MDFFHEREKRHHWGTPKLKLVDRVPAVLYRAAAEHRGGMTSHSYVGTNTRGVAQLVAL